MTAPLAVLLVWTAAPESLGGVGASVLIWLLTQPKPPAPDTAPSRAAPQSSQGPLFGARAHFVIFVILHVPVPDQCLYPVGLPRASGGPHQLISNIV